MEVFQLEVSCPTLHKRLVSPHCCCEYDTVSAWPGLAVPRSIRVAQRVMIRNFPKWRCSALLRGPLRFPRPPFPPFPSIPSPFPSLLLAHPNYLLLPSPHAAPRPAGGVELRQAK